MATDRRELRGVRLTEEAHAGIDALATRARCTRTALIEALGLAGHQGRPIRWDDIVDEAARIDRRRLSRR